MYTHGSIRKRKWYSWTNPESPNTVDIIGVPPPRSAGTYATISTWHCIVRTIFHGQKADSQQIVHGYTDK